MHGSLTVPAELAGSRADKGLADLLQLSRTQTQRLLDQGLITVDGSPLLPSTRLEAGKVVQMVEPTQPTQAPPPVLSLVHVDADLVVVDKPAGLVVHPGAGRSTGTLVAGLLQAFPEIAGVGEENRPGIVHRLDKDTSGLLLVARTQVAYNALTASIRRREVHRRYVALVHGNLSQPRGTIDAPLGRDRNLRFRQSVAADGRNAVTHYRVEQSWPGFTLLEVELDTGRTHQIRVHLSAIGHPVVGDKQYGRRPPPVPLNRHFLHAGFLQLPHPLTGADQVFHAPVPSELAAVLEVLRSGMNSDPG